MFRKTLTIAVAAATVLMPVAGSARAIGQSDDGTAELNAALDNIVTQDSGSWWWYRYRHGSMWGARPIGTSVDFDSRTGQGIVLLRGEFVYDGGTWGTDQPGWVRARLTNGQLTCLSYDTGTKSNCEVYSGGDDWFGWLGEIATRALIDSVVRWFMGSSNNR